MEDEIRPDEFGDTTGPALEELPEQEQDRRTSYATLASILLLVVIVIVILLLWRSCGNTTQTGDSATGDNVIQQLEQLEHDEQSVSLWVRPGASIEDILARNGLGDVEPTDMGDGTYVITVEGDAAALVEQLEADPDLYDAGFVFAEE